MRVVVEIETLEPSERLRWIPIASFNTQNSLEYARVWIAKVKSGFLIDPMVPNLRVVSADGLVLDGAL